MTAQDTSGGPGGTDPIPLRRLSRAAPVPVMREPGPEARAAAAEALGLEALRKLRLSGALIPEGRADWRLEARLGATVVQPCVVTLAPVTTRIDIDLARRYRADFEEPAADEAEMPEDDTAEALPDRLDLSAVMLEALALALPDYPRAEGADLAERHFAPPGVAPMTDEDARPLAGLAALRDRMKDDDGSAET
ncbi:MAG: YceD family protein [Roseicyclus sp.]